MPGTPLARHMVPRPLAAAIEPGDSTAKIALLERRLARAEAARAAAEHLLEQKSRVLAKANTEIVTSAASILRSGTHEVLERIETLQNELRRNERALADARQKLALAGTSGGAAPTAETVNGVAFVGRVVEGIEAKSLRGLVDEEKKRNGSSVVALVLKGEDGKGTIAVGVTDDLTARFSAAELV